MMRPNLPAPTGNAVLSYTREAMDPADEHILWVLDQLQAEGTANQVNLKEAFKPGRVPAAVAELRRGVPG